MSTLVKRHTPRVLVAEDDAEMRRLVVEALRLDGYDVREVTDGGQLLGAASQSDVDLIVSDVRMPAFTGIQILEALRAAGSVVPVILMTAFGDDETHARTKALGAILFDKPFTLGDLRVAVMNMLPPR
jgi:two-component system response regulator (stage 0 sporulation protein F)